MPSTKVCPWCAETIKAQAIVCRYCSRPQPGHEGQVPPSIQSPQVVKQEPGEYEVCSLRLGLTTQSSMPWEGVGRRWQALIGNQVIAEGPEFKGLSTFGDLVHGLTLDIGEGHVKEQRMWEQKKLQFVSQLISEGWEVFPPNQEDISTLRRVKRS